MRERSVRARLLSLALLLLLAPTAVARSLWFVDGVNGNDGNSCKSRHGACKSIGHAISLASPNDAIFVAPAVYYENLTIRINLEIIGSGSHWTVIDGQGLDSVIFIPDQGENVRVVLTGLTIRNGYANYNTGGFGGGIANWGTVYAYDLKVRQNTAGDFDADDGTGAGISNGGFFSLNHSVVEDNKDIISYFSWGGGVYNSGTMTINDSTIRRNLSEATDEYGAGIANGGTMVINRSTISENATYEGSYSFGGGLYNEGEAVLNNSTVYGNACKGGLGAGGIENVGTISISNSTISGNISDGGGGILSNGTSIFQNSIVAANPGGNCYGSMTSGGYNLSNDGSCNFTGPGDLNNVEPGLGALRYNGGPTQTMAELPGSPTIDAGNPSGCTDGEGRLLKTDQRGFPRPGKFKHAHRCDIGAFERQKD
jgi:hypothetical protein